MTLPELEKMISALPPEELSRFRTWFLNFDAEHWDRQIEEDIAMGRLDKLAEKAIRDHQAGNGMHQGT